MAVQVRIGANRHQGAGRRQPIQGLSKIFSHHPADLPRMRKHAIERAVLAEPAYRGLRSDLFDARNIVDAVADQRQVIDDAFRRNAKARYHPVPIEAPSRSAVAAHGVEQLHLIVDQLGQVLVGRDDHDPQAFAPRPFGQGADHVVGLHTRDLQNRPTQRLYRLVDRRDLGGQVVRHRGAIGLVFRVQVVAESLAFRIEHTGPVLGRTILGQNAQHADEAADRPGRFAPGGAQIGQRMKRAVQVPGTIDQQQSRHY